MARITVRFNGTELAADVLPATPRGLIPAEGIVRIGRELELVSSPAGLHALAAVAERVAADLDAERARQGGA